MNEETNKPNLEIRLFEPVDLIPGVGFLTNLNRISNYNTQTDRIRDGTIQSTSSPYSRDIQRTLTSGLSTLYHASTLSAIGLYQFADKLI